MISVRGNKTKAALVIACLTAVLMIFGGLLSQKKARLRLYQKIYTEAVSALEENNNREINEAY